MMRFPLVFTLLIYGATFAMACSGSTGESGTTPPADTGAESDASNGDATASDDSSSPSDDTTEPGDPDSSEPPVDEGEPPGPGEPPAIAPYSGGACPSFAAGSMKFKSGEMERDITITLPDQPEGAGLVFLWHGFGDSHSNFSGAIGAASMSKSHNVITVSAQAVLDPLETEKLASLKALAASVGLADLPPTWSIIDGPDIDMQLFDDLLACMNESYNVDRKRLYTLGFSQGALWSTVLILERSEHLAAALLWSGGLGSTGGLVEVVHFTYGTPARKIPVLAASGGAADIWPNAQLTLVDFSAGTVELVDALKTDGHAAVHCDHGSGHTVPQGGLSWGLQFLFDHKWTADGESQYFGHDGAGFPDYCTFP